MKKIVLLMIVFLFFATYADANPKKRVFILHSYSQEYQWTKLQHDNFVATLQKSLSSPLEFSVEYLDTKRHDFTEEYQSFFLRYLQEKYRGYHPDAIYVTDDNALQFFIRHKNIIFPNVPVFFSGINDLTLIYSLDSNEYTGVFERKDIERNIELIRQFSPQTHDLWIVGDDSTTYQAIEAEIKKKIRLYPTYRFHFVASHHIEEIAARLPRVSRSFVLLTTIGALTDKNGKNMTLKESISRLTQNPYLVLCSTEDAYIMKGVIGGYVTSGVQQGSVSASLLVKYFTGEPINHIRAVVKSPNVYMFDRDALIRSRIILSEYTARNAILLHKEKKFYDKYQQVILNTTFLSSIGILVIFVVVYFVISEKNRALNKIKTKFAHLSKLHSNTKERWALIEKNYAIGYWEYNKKEDYVLFSEGLLDILKTDEAVESHLEGLLSYVHPKDKKEVQETIDDALKSSLFKSIRHKVVYEEGSIKTVVHQIRSFVNQDGNVEKVLGMVQTINE